MTIDGQGLQGLRHHHPGLYHTFAWTGTTSICIIGVIFLFGTSKRPPPQG
jgi:hypothetical protein